MTFEISSPFLVEFDKLILRLIDTGFIVRPTIKQFVNHLGKEYVEVDYDSIANNEANFYWSLFIVMVCAYSLAIIILVIEVLHKHCHYKFKNQMQKSWQNFNKKLKKKKRQQI